MYNGIGLTTPRGSGTNGYVQRNFAMVRNRKEKVDYKTEEEIRKMESAASGPLSKPNQEILDHERKRKIELKCVEMEELMDDQGYSKEEIETKVLAFRRALMEQQANSIEGISKDEFGRPDAHQTHQLAEANQEKNARLREAFGIDRFYVDGSSMDPDRKLKEAAAAQLAVVTASIAADKSVAAAAHKKGRDIDHHHHRRKRSPSSSPPPSAIKKSSSSSSAKKRSASSDRETSKKKKKAKKRKHEKKSSKRKK